MLRFEEMVKMTQPLLKKALVKELYQMKYRTQTKPGFIYAEGKLPVLLVAHMDTVHETCVKTVCRSDSGNILMSPEGIGGDDRAGVYMVLEILKKQRCHVLFTEDEETGAKGARAFAESGIAPKVNFIIELDRRGANDAVFYDCDNPEFTKFVEGFGFKEAAGSFSDISVIAPKLGIAAVNISAGYYHEHTKHEYVNMKAVNNNINRVCKMVSCKTCRFEYIEAVYYGKYNKSVFGFYEDIDDFDRYYEQERLGDYKTFMLLSDKHHIKLDNGLLFECDGEQCIDENGKLYKYLWDLDMVVEIEGCALTENCMPAVFMENDMVFAAEVVSREFANRIL